MPRGRPVREQDRAAICALYEGGGESLRSLSQMYGISHEGVRKILQASGIPLRSRVHRISQPPEVVE